MSGQCQRWSGWGWALGIGCGAWLALGAEVPAAIDLVTLPVDAFLGMDARHFADRYLLSVLNGEPTEEHGLV